LVEKVCSSARAKMAAATSWIWVGDMEVRNKTARRPDLRKNLPRPNATDTLPQV
jgi:hypothetical protein